MATDPVCKMEVEPEKAAAKSAYKGKDYFFCAETCRQKFDAEPEKYLGAAEPERAGFWGRMFKG
jgi:YHS domain-containing protein